MRSRDFFDAANRPARNHAAGDVRAPIRPEDDDEPSADDPPDEDNVSDQLPIAERG